MNISRKKERKKKLEKHKKNCKQKILIPNSVILMVNILMYQNEKEESVR